MEHIAIDLGGRESQICVRDEAGRVVEERRTATGQLGRYLAQRSRSRVIVETCAEAFHVADQALGLGHEVRVVPATLVRSLGVGSRGIKTDRRDAQILSEVSCRIDLPSVHIPSQRARELKTLCGMRDALVKARSQLICTVRGWLRGKAQRIEQTTPARFCQRVRAKCGELPSMVERQLVMIEALNEQVKAADDELKKTTAGDPICQRLQTVPGVGPVIALRFVAAIDDIRRFKSAHALESYLGLVPGEHSSSDTKRRTGITKAGSSALRAALVQGAWSARLCAARNLDPMGLWALEVEKRRGKCIAVVALARKMAGVLFALWRDGSSYDRAWRKPERSVVTPN